VQENEDVLDRTLLEHQLSTLGDRRQEVPFENFARRLCQNGSVPLYPERHICNRDLYYYAGSCSPVLMGSGRG